MQFLARRHVHLEHTYLVSLVLAVGVHELYKVARLDAAVYYLEVSNDATEGVEHAIEDKSLQRSVFIALGVGDTFHHGTENFWHTLAGLATGTENLLALAAQQFYNLVLHLLGHGIGHVALVDYGNNLKVVVDGHIQVADGLRLHSLSGIHNEQCTLACCYGAGNLVTEVHVSRSVDEIQCVASVLYVVANGQRTLASASHIVVFHLYGMALDGDAALLFQVHVVEHLAVCCLDGFGYFQ